MISRLDWFAAWAGAIFRWDVAAGSFTYEFVKKGELKRRLSGLFDPLSAIV